METKATISGIAPQRPAVVAAPIIETQGRNHAKATASIRRRFLLATTVAVALLELYFYDLIPNSMSTRWFVVISCLLGLVLVVRAPGQRLVKAGFIMAGCCAGLALADLAMRPLLIPKIFGPRELFMYRWAPMPSVWRFAPNVAYNGVVGGDLARNVGFHTYQIQRQLVFKTDSHGFRNDLLETRQTQDPIDLILLGDSVGTGAGTTQSETWASIFAQMYHLHTYNLSMPKSSPWHELMNLEIESQRLHTDKKTVVLWVMFSGNDLDDTYEDGLTPSVSHKWWRPIYGSLLTFRSLSPIRVISEGIQWRLRLQHPMKPVVVRTLEDGRNILFRPRYQVAVERTYDQVRQHPNYPKLIAIIDEMKRFAATQNLSVAVVVAPAKEEIYSWVLNGTTAADDTMSGFSKAVADRCAMDGLTFLDLKPLFIQAARTEFAKSGKLLWWEDDTHWNGLGHQLAASVVYTQLLLPMRKRQFDGINDHPNPAKDRELVGVDATAGRGVSELGSSQE